jgi:hypothetical protein
MPVQKHSSFIKREPIELSNLVHLDSSFIKREPIELRSNLVHLA